MDLDHQHGIYSIVTSLRDISCGIALFLIFKVGQGKIKSRQQRRLDGATFEKRKRNQLQFSFESSRIQQLARTKTTEEEW
jgi:hypothetical protein